MSQVVVTRDAGGKYLSAVRHSYPSGTNPRCATRFGRRLLVTGSIHYTVKLASAVSRRRRKSKTVHAQRPDQIPPRAFYASNAPFAKRRGRGSVATAGDAPRTPPSFPRRREPREKQSTPSPTSFPRTPSSFPRGLPRTPIRGREPREKQSTPIHRPSERVQTH